MSFIKRGDGKILGLVDPDKLDDSQKQSVEELKTKVSTKLSDEKDKKKIEE